MLSFGNTVVKSLPAGLTLSKIRTIRLPESLNMIIDYNTITFEYCDENFEVLLEVKSPLTDEQIDDAIRLALKFMKGIENKFKKFDLQRVIISRTDAMKTPYITLVFHDSQGNENEVNLYFNHKSIELHSSIDNTHKEFISTEDLEKYLDSILPSARN